jgi:hypothetical protein
MLEECLWFLTKIYRTLCTITAKMSPVSLAAFGLGWYISDNLTRDEKQSWQRQMEEEFNRSIKNQDDDRKARERRLKKSAFDELQEHYQRIIR